MTVQYILLLLLVFCKKKKKKTACTAVSYVFLPPSECLFSVASLQYSSEMFYITPYINRACCTSTPLSLHQLSKSSCDGPLIVLVIFAMYQTELFANRVYAFDANCYMFTIIKKRGKKERSD